MGDLVSQDVDFWAKSTPPGDGTCPFDRLPTEVVQNILSQLNAQAPRGVNPLLALRQTCRLFNMLCARLLSRRRVIFEGPDAHTQDEVPAQPFLSVVISSAPRARSVRKLVFDDASRRVLQQFLQDITWWTAVLVNVEEVVLSSTQRIKLDLDSLTRFKKLRHLSLAHADLATFSRDPRFLHLVTLVLSSVTLSEPWFLGRHAMPALRRLSIADCGVPRPPDRTQRWTTDLVPQLELLDIGESRRADANVGLILPLADLPDALPVVWRVDVDRALVRVTFPRARAVLRRHAFVRLTVDDDTPDSSTGWERLPPARPERLAKILDILAALPNLQLLLVPHDLWPPLAHPAPASQAQQAILDECARRGIALRTYERRAGKEEGLVPEFEAFLREREEAAREAGTAGR
ncbi:hypothetical protein JCM9279_004971 [Rhodotorula babjevae]